MSSTRREFARAAALAAAAAALAPKVTRAQAKPAAPKTPPAPKAAGGPLPALPAASRAEAEGRIQMVLSRFGHRLSEPQKAKLRRLAYDYQKEIDAVRAFPLELPDEPAGPFRVYRSPRAGKHAR